eukprot:8238665-Pyramimonas_sp.AAC.1
MPRNFACLLTLLIAQVRRRPALVSTPRSTASCEGVTGTPSRRRPVITSLKITLPGATTVVFSLMTKPAWRS